MSSRRQTHVANFLATINAHARARAAVNRRAITRTRERARVPARALSDWSIESRARLKPDVNQDRVRGAMFDASSMLAYLSREKARSILFPRALSRPD
jgi:hypothetical protein